MNFGRGAWSGLVVPRGWLRAISTPGHHAAIVPPSRVYNASIMRSWLNTLLRLLIWQAASVDRYWYGIQFAFAVTGSLLAMTQSSTKALDSLALSPHLLYCDFWSTISVYLQRGSG